MTAWRYKISLDVLKNISRMSAVKTRGEKFRIPSRHVISSIINPPVDFFVCRLLYLLQRRDNPYIAMDPGDRSPSPESSINTVGHSVGAKFQQFKIMYRGYNRTLIHK